MIGLGGWRVEFEREKGRVVKGIDEINDIRKAWRSALQGMVPEYSVQSYEAVLAGLPVLSGSGTISNVPSYGQTRRLE